MGTKSAQTTRIKVEQSSGNVFADLGFPSPELERLKATLMLHIHRIITARHLEILEKRLADLAANPKAGRSWDAVLARLTRRTRRL